VISWLSLPAAFTLTESPLRVITEGIACGQTVRKLSALIAVQQRQGLKEV
jgi:purine nucleosidase